MTSYSPSRNYLYGGLSALGLALLTGWMAWRFGPIIYLASALFVASAIVCIVLAFQPPIELYENHLAVGKRTIRWNEILRLDRALSFPLIFRLTLTNDRRFWLIYSGDSQAAKSLLPHIRRCAKDALIDGIPYRQFWGELLPPGPERRQLPSPRYPILRAEDEAEVERLFQRLKTVGHLDPKSSDEK